MAHGKSPISRILSDRLAFFSSFLAFELADARCIDINPGQFSPIRSPVLFDLHQMIVRSQSGFETSCRQCVVCRKRSIPHHKQMPAPPNLVGVKAGSRRFRRREAAQARFLLWEGEARRSAALRHVYRKPGAAGRFRPQLLECFPRLPGGAFDRAAADPERPIETPAG